MSLQVHVLNKSYVIVAMRTPAPRCSSPPDRLYRPWWPAGLRASVRGDGHEKAVENEKVSYYITLVCAVEAPYYHDIDRSPSSVLRSPATNCCHFVSTKRSDHDDGDDGGDDDDACPHVFFLSHIKRVRRLCSVTCAAKCFRHRKQNERKHKNKVHPTPPSVLGRGRRFARWRNMDRARDKYHRCSV